MRRGSVARVRAHRRAGGRPARGGGLAGWPSVGALAPSTALVCERGTRAPSAALVCERGTRAPSAALVPARSVRDYRARQAGVTGGGGCRVRHSHTASAVHRPPATGHRPPATGHRPPRRSSRLSQGRHSPSAALAHRARHSFPAHSANDYRARQAGRDRRRVAAGSGPATRRVRPPSTEAIVAPRAGSSLAERGTRAPSATLVPGALGERLPRSPKRSRRPRWIDGAAGPWPCRTIREQRGTASAALAHRARHSFPARSANEYRARGVGARPETVLTGRGGDSSAAGARRSGAARGAARGR